jgi:hypothetical protein
MEAINGQLAIHTVKFYACSNCWGDLEAHPDMMHDDSFFVLCKKCGDDTKGYVTRHFVERRRNDNEFEKRDATHLLRKLGIIDDPLKDKKADDLLKELGF